ncbi:MAG TPA: hypothetical protein VLQ93_24450, partial [Myxococcaceae bacterium]|nr:hypothetical protein [Myxococcaceae bacterium]
MGLLALPGISGNVPLPDRAACCTGAVAVGDSMISPSNGGDKDFFEVPSSPPSAVFLLGNNESMMDFPEYLPEVGDTSVPGCTDPDQVAAMKQWFDINDPAKDGSTPVDADAGLTSVFFKPERFYHSRGRRLSVNGTNSPDSWPFSLAPNFIELYSETDTSLMCSQALGVWWPLTPEHSECQRCLTEVGWWRGITTADPSERWDVPPLPPEARSRWILSGRFLNQHPPKFVVARKVLKDVIGVADNVRMGVATFGPDNGWYDPPVMTAKLRPACNYSFPTINEGELNRPLLRQAVNSIHFNNNERSIGEALFGIGGYFSSQLVDGRWASWFQQPLDPGWGWPGGYSGGTIDNAFTGQPGDTWGYDIAEWLKWSQYWEGSGYERSVCFSCQVNSVIVLTDGAPKYDNTVPITKMMEILIANGAKHPDGTPVTFDSSNPETNLNSGGVNYCDQFGVTKEDCDYTNFNWPHGLAKGNKNFMDDVAFFLANTDLRGDMPGVQSITTHTIGYGDNSPMLRSISLAGKGKFARADDATELREAIMTILGEIKQVSTSFSAANISGVQAGGVQSAAYVPRFVPRRGRPYEGHLYRFFYYSEFAQGCQDSVAKSLAGDPLDLNGDKDCDDTFFLDKPAGFTVAPGAVPDVSTFTSLNIVQENTDGIWVKAVTATKDADGRLVGGQEAEPFWDLAETLGQRSASKPCDPNNPLDATGGRCIFTMIDRNDDGKFTELDNPPIAFETSNLAELKKYLLGAGDGFCVGLFAKKQLAWTGTLAEQEQCASLLIDFVRGVNIFNYEGVGETVDIPCADDKTKSCKLADIFHSTPVSVEPPIEPFLCTLGLGSQCLSTLYSDFSASVTSEALCSTPGAPKPCY